MSVESGIPAAATAAAELEWGTGPLHNRFHVVAVACEREKQIRSGSRARVAGSGHKPCIQAVAEVVAGTVLSSFP